MIALLGRCKISLRLVQVKHLCEYSGVEKASAITCADLHMPDSSPVSVIPWELVHEFGESGGELLASVTPVLPHCDTPESAGLSCSAALHVAVWHLQQSTISHPANALFATALKQLPLLG